MSDLFALAGTVQTLAGEVSALGPLERERADAAIGVAARLADLRDEAQALLGELAARRPALVAAQLARLGLTRRSKGLKLNLGAGETRIEGFLNIDAWPADLALDLRWGLPFGGRAVDAVYCCHALEHFAYPDAALALLKEIRRVLARGGVARIVVPDIEQCIAAYVANDRRFYAARRETWSWWPARTTRLDDFLSYAGVGSDTRNLTEDHKYGYDFETLSALLRRAGFGNVERSAFMQSRHPALRVDDASAIAGATYGESHYSLFVDAWR